MKLADIYLQFQADIQYIEKELERAVRSKEPVLNEAANHLLKAGGKRIRPVFVLLSGKFGKYDIEKLKYVAVPLELIHMATLVHDDVIDDADKRRGKLTVKAQWDNRIAMYTGDYILARSLTYISHLKDPKIHQILSDGIVQMCEGEIEQIRYFNHWQQGLKIYLRRIKRKTALLIAISCKLGALVSGAPAAVVRRLYNYGYNIGMAFQITDDILDFVGNEKKLGKPAGSDLKQGNITLPAIYALKYSEDRARLKDWIIQGNIEQNVEEAVHIVKESGGIEFSLQLAERYLHKSLAHLSYLPDISSKDALKKIACFIAERQF